MTSCTCDDFLSMGDLESRLDSFSSQAVDKTRVNTVKQSGLPNTKYQNNVTAGDFWPSELRNTQTRRLKGIKRSRNDPLRADMLWQHQLQVFPSAQSPKLKAMLLPVWTSFPCAHVNGKPLSKLTHLDPQTTGQARWSQSFHSSRVWSHYTAVSTSKCQIGLQ